MSELCDFPAMCTHIARYALPPSTSLSPALPGTPPPTSAVRASPSSLNGSGPRSARSVKSFKPSRSAKSPRSASPRSARTDSLDRWEGGLGAAAVYEGAPWGWAMAGLLEQARHAGGMRWRRH